MSQISKSLNTICTTISYFYINLYNFYNIYIYFKYFLWLYTQWKTLFNTLAITGLMVLASSN